MLFHTFMIIWVTLSDVNLKYLTHVFFRRFPLEFRLDPVTGAALPCRLNQVFRALLVNYKVNSLRENCAFCALTLLVPHRVRKDQEGRYF